MKKRTHIVIAEPSIIIRSGLITILQRSNSLSVDIAELSDISSITDDLRRLNPEILIINPAYLGYLSLSKLRECCDALRIIAMQSSLTDQTILKNYDESISIYDSADSIVTTLFKVVESEQEHDNRNELSQREKEIVVCIAKGMSNKEIADTLFLSTHTVISHRRNITAKLSIHSASGLTIYAIVNKLIELDSIPTK